MLNLLQAARLAKLAYAGESAFEHQMQVQLKLLGETRVDHQFWEPASDPNQAYAVVTEKKIIVSVKGTDFLDRESAAQNFRKRRIRVGGLSFHEGYYIGISQLLKRGLDGYVKSWAASEPIGQQSRELIIIGHSAGGCLADLLSGLLWQDAVKASHVFTFAAPRGSGRVHAQLQRRRFMGGRHRYRRVVSTSDPVPWVPFYWQGWRHAYPATYLNRKNERIRAASCPYMLFDGMMNRIQTATLFAAREAHSIDTYIRKLEENPCE